MIALTTKGCRWAEKKNGGCLHCDLFQSTLYRADISQEATLQQFDRALDEIRADGLKRIEVFVSGSFYDGKEVAAETRDHILGRLAAVTPRIDILVESRPEFVDAAVIRESRRILKDRKLIVALALETSNDAIREDSINKGFRYSDFKKASIAAVAGGADLQIYMLLKPPFLSEREAVDDAVRTIRDILVLSREIDILPIIALEPVFVLKNTVVEELYRRGSYRPPWLWSVVEVLKTAYHLPLSARLDIFVGEAGDVVTPHAIRENQTAAGGRCGCSDILEKLICDFNRSKDIRVFDHAPLCSCKLIWSKLVFG